MAFVALGEEGRGVRHHHRSLKNNGPIGRVGHASLTSYKSRPVFLAVCSLIALKRMACSPYSIQGP
jgi:hypothetical protein